MAVGQRRVEVGLRIAVLRQSVMAPLRLPMNAKIGGCGKKNSATAATGAVRVVDLTWID